MKTQLDLNLLFIAESLYKTLNVSKTAKELSMSQSAVSHALSRLRDHFNDPLFVRVSKGMAMTEVAKGLQVSIERLTEEARKLSQSTEKFDPKTSQGRITIATTDYTEVILIPHLLQRLKKEAPHVQISIRPTGGSFPKSELESGMYDLAIAGFYKDLPEGFYMTKVFEDSFSTAYRKNHPKIKGELNAAQFYECDHALITLQGDFKEVLKVKGQKQRNFQYGSYSFTSMAWTLSSSDLVLTAPTLLLKKYQEYFPIKIQKVPIEAPTIEFRMVWHALTHKDPLKSWFRDVLKSEFNKLRSNSK
ncbi:LysR family transcriptional regulator [Peredibacter starrii]|uniref:LysR family transcriptional regulator n=1 Tax=Peredibacter starrii TaxID=28202 RepID=A0AAX4HMU3_9BACT|nr:LysR family transcriptional regulator [Peredibacter starrii]WPU64551.1 LysR family transcriptional regulator [Peredibacter starrii]